MTAPESDVLARPSRGTAVDRETFLADVALSERLQVLCAWCGPAFVVLLFGGWGLIGGLIPMIPPSESAAYVARAYTENADLHRFGLILGMIGVFLTIPFFLVISLQMRRTEPRVPTLSILQFASGIIVTVVLMVPMLLFVCAAFRPERAPELTMMLNDVSYVMLILPWPPILGQLFAFATAVFHDRRRRPVFPRWTGYYNVWVSILLLPASLIIFFKHGLFAWNGLIGFWVPAAVFGTWYLIMAWVVLRAVRGQAAEDRAAAPDPHPAGVP